MTKQGKTGRELGEDIAKCKHDWQVVYMYPRQVDPDPLYKLCLVCGTTAPLNKSGR